MKLIQEGKTVGSKSRVFSNHIRIRLSKSVTIFCLKIINNFKMGFKLKDFRLPVNCKTNLSTERLWPNWVTDDYSLNSEGDAQR